ncbi:erythroblast NAD(P)(+)--arginine ADP-ribosyltransferase-like isoform X1 [Balearica regulorum gibbericeps]|uniref:erythroblast NAD(P)(+)--arginine ADP-ribosyltransferase-like isoform X1 n=2 Tax=Balearica regulorum gibbericeps TaxID=100784 RepID=UPI003F640CF9
MQLGVLSPSLPRFSPQPPHRPCRPPRADPALAPPLPQPLAEEPAASLPTAPRQLGASPGGALPAMEHLVLGLVLLSGTLDSASPRHCQDQHPFKVLDMAPSSFDDQYQGCSRMMEKELEELNRTEFTDKDYAEAWKKGAAEWQSKPHHVSRVPALRREHAVALLAYTWQCDPYTKFNAAVRVAGRSREEYLNTFHFKVLHFLLSEALRVLRDAQPQKCHHVYRGIRGIRFTAQQHQSIRFGQFTSASLRKVEALKFGKDTLFSVETCYGVLIRNFSFFTDEEEVLIPPFEIFEVTNITHNGNRAFIQLRSQGASSTYNCEWVKEKRCKTLACVFSAGRSIHGDLPRLWGFLLASTALAAAVGS